MKSLLIAFSIVIAASSSAFATNFFGDGSPENGANAYNSTQRIIREQNLSNHHFGFSHGNKTDNLKNHFQNEAEKASTSFFQPHYGDGSPDNQQNK